MRRDVLTAARAILDVGRFRDRRREFIVGAIAVAIGAAILFLAVLPAYLD